MTLSKRFMDLATALTHTSKVRKLDQRQWFMPGQPPQAQSIFSARFRILSWHLLRSYLGAMVAVMGLSSVAVYQFFTYSLYEQLDNQLATIADAARHSFPAVQADPTVTNFKLPRIADDDGDLDLPWQDLRGNHQSVEWFASNHHRLSKAGALFPETPLVLNFHPQQQQRLRVLTLPIYSPKTTEKHQLPQGYVRVSAAIGEIEEEQKRLLLGLCLGGTVSILLISGTGCWLTARSLKPIEQSMQKLQQFTADASHELRSPLTAVKTAVEVMQSHPDRIHPADVKKVEAIANATQQMVQLIEDLLMLARADMPLKPTTPQVSLPIHEILEDLIEFLQPQATAKHISLQSTQLNQAFIPGDAKSLRRLFVNLLDNAIKYTPKGGTITVALSLLDQSVIVSVQDSGIGIAPEHLPRVFDRLWRADSARAHQDGAGLGLAIAQAIAQAHGGEIIVSSQIGTGSCFKVHLPRVKNYKF